MAQESAPSPPSPNSPRTTTTGPPADGGGEGELLPRASLSMLDVVAQSVGFLGPVFSVSTLLPQLVGITTATGNGAGAAAPLAVLLGTVGMLGVGWIVAAYARRVRSAGSLYSYVTLGLGERAGAVAGYVYYLGVLALGAALSVLIGGVLHDDLATEFGLTAVPVWVWQLAFGALVLTVVHIGVQVSVKAQLALALVSMVVLTVFFVSIVVTVGDGNSIRPFEPSSSAQGWSGIAFSVIYGVLLFTGFETAANLAEETAEPRRAVPRAVLISIGAAAGFFLLGSYAQIAGFHFSAAAVAKDAGAPLVALAGSGEFGGTWIARLVELVILLDMLAVYIGCSVSITRGAMTMARDGWLPRVFTRLGRRGTPVAGTVLIGVGYALTVAFAGAFPHAVAIPGLSDYFSWYAWISAFGIFCLALIYLTMCLGAPHGLRETGRRTAPPLVWIASVVGLLVTAGALFGAVYKVPAPTIWSAYGAVGWVLVSTAAAVVLHRRKQNRSPQA